MLVSANNGAARGRVDNLLFFHDQTAPCEQASVRGSSCQHHDHTFVYSFYTSRPSLTTESPSKDTLIPSYSSDSANDTLRSTSVVIIDQETGTSPTTQHSLERDQTHDDLSRTQRLHIRALTHSFDTRICTMTEVTNVPGSPPDLAGSGSSKSSSYGSQFSVADEASTEITNFEEIGLEDDGKSGHGKMSGSTTNAISAETEPQPVPYYTSRRAAAPLNLRQAKGSMSDAPKSTIGPLERSFTNPSTAASSGQEASTSLPQHRLPRSASATSLEHGSLNVSSGRYPFASSRRGSWQPRKTIKEIEAEFHDSDDDLPEDASLWNVPISPFLSSDHSARSSARGSPNRAHILSPRPLPLEHVKSAPDSPPNYKGPATQPLPRQRMLTRSSTSVDVSKSNPSSPRVRGSLRDQRTKSWNMAMTELSAEARILSQNLEYHAEQQGKTSSQRSRSEKWSPPNPYRSSAPSTIQLPPIQRGTLDFMPISKEKEAILSRTRPSWLPPKDPKEEKKHLKEYQRMMAASLEAEKKKENYQKNQPCEQDDTQARLDRVWSYYVEPTTDIMSIDRRVHDLCWRGISPRVRGRVWQRTIGNPLGLTKKTYEKALERAKDVKAKTAQDRSQHETGLIASFSDIERDAETAFPELNVFQPNGPLWQDLINLCEAHACYRGDIGHLYGIQLIGALMLLQVPDAADAFILLENCLNSPVPLAFQTGDVTLMQRTCSRVMSTLGIKFPRLHEYLFEAPEEGGLGLTGEAVFEPMFRTMFSNGLDIDRLCRVWDIWMFEGDRALVKTAVALLGSLQTQIFDVTGDVDLKRRNVQEMLGWGPFNRTDRGGYWCLQSIGGEDAFVEEIRTAGKLDYTGR